MRALITGIRGFTGRYVAEELRAAGWEVFGTGVGDEDGDPCYRKADVLDAPRLHAVVDALQPDAVVHLAAIAFVEHDDPSEFYRVNVIGTRNLLAALAALSKRPQCVLLASSANVYGNATEGMLSESMPANPANDYAVSKLAMEYMARLWLDRLPVVVVRPFNYTGVGQSERFLVPKIVAHFRRRAETIRLGNLDVWRDFSDVRSVARAYRRLLEVRPVGGILNVCSGHVHSLREVLAMAESITGHRMRVEVDPAFVRGNEVRRLWGDPGRLREVLGGWEVEGLEGTVRWMLGRVTAH